MKYLALVLSLLLVSAFTQTYDTYVADIFAGDVGTVPTDAEMLNGGKPSVDHGVILFEAP
jgi:hypothetical protein